MPAVNAPARVLVTGASGFLGIHVVKSLIDRGYHVRGTVRNQKKGDYIKKLFGERFEPAIVPDMEAPDAYDEAVVGMDAVQHVASVVKMTTEHPDVVIKPAIAGTVGILESVKKYGPTVKRIVITSSMSAVGGMTEDDWNQGVVDLVEAQGIKAHPGVKYAASKVLAERAAWDFVKQNTGKISFDVVILLPAWIWGPMIHEGTDAGSINGSNNYLLHTVHPDHAASGDALLGKDGEFIDVRDCASAHVDVLSKEGAANQRFIILADSYTWQDVYDALNEEPGFANIPTGVPSASNDKKWPTPSSNKYLTLVGKSHEEAYRPLRTVVREAMDSALARGWVWTGQF